jgi:hypothetical protein
VGRKGPPPPGFPDDLPEGTTLLDVPDHEVLERPEVFAQMFDWLRGQVENHVAAGCPAEKDEDFCRTIMGCIDYYVSAFPGARDWRQARDDAVRSFIKQGALKGLPRMHRFF